MKDSIEQKCKWFFILAFFGFMFWLGMLLAPIVSMWIWPPEEPFHLTWEMIAW